MAQNNYMGGYVYNKVPNASVSDTTPPTFSGIATLVAQGNGSLRATWTAASDATTPIYYEIYISTGAIDYSKKVARVKALTFDLFQDTLGLLLYNTVYYVAVRAVDGVGNVETNITVLNATSGGVATDSTYNLITTVQGLVIAGL